MITKKHMEADGFFDMDPKNQLDLRIYAEWLNERGFFQKAKLCWGQAALEDLLDHFKLGAFDEDISKINSIIWNASHNRQKVIEAAQHMMRVDTVRAQLQVGDVVRYCEGMSSFINPHQFISSEVTEIDGDTVTLNVRFWRRNRRCSTTAQVHISNIHTFHTPERNGT